MRTRIAMWLPTAMLVAVLLLCGCARNRLASLPLTEQQQEWQTSIARSYPAWQPPCFVPLSFAPSAVDIRTEAFGHRPDMSLLDALPAPAPAEDFELVPVDRVASAFPAQRTYTVRKGDTLQGIARRFYGTAGGWHRILEANNAQLTAPENLKPGMVLDIPPYPDGN